MITRYGLDNAAVMLGAGGCLILLALTPIGTIGSISVIVVGILLVAFTLWFFRDPERTISSDAVDDESWIVSPADGTVTDVESITGDEYLGGSCVQISIFLSPLNVHVNRYPASGKIIRVLYIPGKYLMAFNPKASTENERSIFVLQNAFGTIVYRQITGFLARRIVYDTQEGEHVHAGSRFGMMKFGSRMDVVVPEGSEILVRPGQKVISATSLIARLRRTGS